ncbi:hypothetical protein [Planctomyces sp. SH-PL14]|uniref:hypothetical protein n=1 Tax=Planctomyces sp. SH-PL14 TaxID=1632864 RepID=UPI00078EF433|nr:hypothetical protein [Planctomyces sp. SH-PL14]AMV20965.1 hypothetical protein VT03_23890 [Planctomyces sp. SH-PL14]
MSDAIHTPSSETASFPKPRFPVERPVRKDEQTLAQAGRVMEQLRLQLAELDRREETLNQQLATLDQESRSLKAWSQQFTEEADRRERELRATERRIVDREQACDVQHTALSEKEQDLNRQRDELAAEREAMKESLERELYQERAKVVEAQQQFQDERTAAQEQLDERRAEIERLREERLGPLDEREQTVERREQELHQREIDLEKRTRFHEDHLKRLRQEIAGQKSDLEQERQSLRVWSVQVEESIHLRLRHVQRFRDLLEEREKACDEERHLLHQSRRSLDEELIRRRAELEAEKAEFLAETEKRAADVQDQQNAIAAQLEAVEDRQTELDRLQQEIEATHQENLEMRAAVDEAYADLCAKADEALVRERLTQSRAMLHEQFRRVHDAIAEQKSAVAGLLSELDEQRQAYRAERDSTAAWLRQREADVEQRQAALARERGQHHAGEGHWIAARDRWRNEKLEAETIIRGLVTELETLLSTRPAPPRADSIAALPLPKVA